MNLILLGPPGAGKGTQAELLTKKFGIPAISTGNILRAAIKDGTTVGTLAKQYIDRGALVPDEVILDILFQRLRSEDCRAGYILDGAPRTVAQAQALEEHGLVIDAVLYLAVPDEDIVQRMAGRRVCECCGASYHLRTAPPKLEGICDDCGGRLVHRLDDTPQTVEKRLAVYHKETEPLRAFYAQRGLLKPVKDHRSVETAFREILNVLGE